MLKISLTLVGLLYVSIRPIAHVKSKLRAVYHVYQEFEGDKLFVLVDVDQLA